MGGGGLIGRDQELAMIADLLMNARLGPSMLVIDGEAGIGKTSLCRAATEEAIESAFTALTTSGAATEMSLAWAGLADLVNALDPHTFAGLSDVHKQALNAVSGGDGSSGGERLVATAFLAALEQQSSRGPVMVVIDDAQWLDDSSRLALGFAIRRLSGAIAVVAAYRSHEGRKQDFSWLQPADPQTLTRLTLGPLSLSEMQDVIDVRMGSTPSRPTMARIHAISAGNPFYALELARAVAEKRYPGHNLLPPTLSRLVQERIGDMDSCTADAVITAAAAIEPTVDVVAAATGSDPAALVDSLEPLERRGLIIVDGVRIRFSHPLIASGIIDVADPVEVRRIHRRLAGVVSQPESRARHLALGSTHADPETLAALDAAAEIASARGAFGTAAELVNLAIRLGGNDHVRQLRGAEYNFRAGALDDAEGLVGPIIDELPAGFLRAVGLMLLAAVRGYRDGIASTITLFDRAVHEAEGFAPVRTQAMLLLSLATGIGGDMATCVRLAREARSEADAIGLPELQSQALSLWSHVSFMYGLGVDSDTLSKALEIEDPETDAPVMLRPTPVYALNCAWTGRLDEAHATMTEVRRRCEERGTELDALWATEQLTWIDVALGRYDDAARSAADALRRAKQIGGRLPMITAQTAIAHAAAYQGRLDEARAAAEHAADGAGAAGLNYLSDPPLMSLAFALVSHEQYEPALQTLKPLLESFDPIHDTEIMAAAWVPDAVEALVSLERAGEAEPLVVALETNGQRLDRPWMLAVGARSRAWVAAARGDLDDALRSAERALAHHDRLPMPFERARSQLLLGQLHRRRRHLTAAQENISQAAAVFEDLSSPVWKARADRELERLSARSSGSAITDSERRVAELAASGLSNKEIAATLFLSAKTVEMYLTNVYRKLGIRSRAQLSDRLKD